MSIIKKSLRTVKAVAVEVGRQLVRGSGSPLYKVQRGQGVARVAERHFGRMLWTLTLHQRGDGTGWWDLQEKEGTRADHPLLLHNGHVTYDRPEALPHAVKEWTASVLRRSLKVNLGEPSGSGSPKFSPGHRAQHSPARDRVIYWIASVGPGGKERIPMYFKGRLARDTDEGSQGDVKARPVRLGPGPYTAVYDRDSFEDEAGRPLFGARGDFGGQH